MAMVVVLMIVVVVLGNGAVCATLPLSSTVMYNSRTLHRCCWHSMGVVKVVGMAEVVVLEIGVVRWLLQWCCRH